jgi:hypothetical protein
MDEALLVPEDRLPHLEDIWLQLHLVFECMWAYRFLYRDLVDILARNRKLKLRFARIMTRASASAADLMRGLVRAGVMRASAAEIRALAENVLLIATSGRASASCAAARPSRPKRISDEASIRSWD